METCLSLAKLFRSLIGNVRPPFSLHYMIVSGFYVFLRIPFRTWNRRPSIFRIKICYSGICHVFYHFFDGIRKPRAAQSFYRKGSPVWHMMLEKWISNACDGLWNSHFRPFLCVEWFIYNMLSYWTIWQKTHLEVTLKLLRARRPSGNSLRRQSDRDMRASRETGNRMRRWRTCLVVDSISYILSALTIFHGLPFALLVRFLDGAALAYGWTFVSFVITVLRIFRSEKTCS